MGPSRTYGRVQTFPCPDPEIAGPKSLLLLLGEDSYFSADDLHDILNAAITSHKKCLRIAAADACSSQDWKFIDSYLDGNAVLLDAIGGIQLRLESIKAFLQSIPIGLHYLEGEHSPNVAVMQRAAVALESSSFKAKHRRGTMEKSILRIKLFGKKLSESKSVATPTNELCNSLRDAWETAVLAIEVLNPATSFRLESMAQSGAPKAEQLTTALSDLRCKVKAVSRKEEETAACLGELASVDLAAHTLLKLISEWGKGEDVSSELRRIAGELKQRKELLEKTFLLLEENTEKLYKVIVGVRVGMLGLLSKAERKDKDLVMVQSSNGCFEVRQMNVNYYNPKQLQRTVTWVKEKAKVTRRSCSFNRLKPQFIGYFKSSCANQVQ